MKSLSLVVAIVALVTWLAWSRAADPVAPVNASDSDSLKVVVPDPQQAPPKITEQVGRDPVTPVTAVTDDLESQAPDEEEVEEDQLPERIDIANVELAHLIQALKDEATEARRECYDEMLVQNLALAAKLTGPERAQAEESARELSDAEYAMRILRNQILENRHVYKQPPTVKVEATPDKVWMGQTGTLRVGKSIADYFISAEEYPELQKTVSRWQRARGTFRKLTTH